MNKHRILLITQSRNTKQGMYSYLESIFRNYIHIDTALTVQINEKYPFDQYDLLLFPASITYDLVKEYLAAQHNILIASRILDPANLHRIVNIPPSSSVYLVNDAKSSAEESIQYLQDTGFTQYHYVPFFPGCFETNQDIHYAITVGEPEFVPSSVSTVINIGSRIVDISTINAIVTFFSLPASLLNEVTRNYITNLATVLKLSNGQLYQSLQQQRMNTLIFNNIPVGFCLYEYPSNLIHQFNLTFVQALSLSRSDLLGANIKLLFQEYTLSADFLTPDGPDHLDFLSSAGNRIQLAKYQVRRTGSQIYYLLLTEDSDASSSTHLPDAKQEEQQLAHLGDYLTQDPKCLAFLENAKKIALTDYHLIIQGEGGTGKVFLAQGIHAASPRHHKPFIHLSAATLPSNNMEELLFGSEDTRWINGQEQVHIQSGLLEKAEGGTFFIEDIERMPLSQQALLLSVLRNGCIRRKGGHQNIPLNLRVIASSTVDLYQAVADGTFLNELYFYLNVFSLYTIPLRKRSGDIPFIMEKAMQNALHTSGFHLSQMASEEFLSFLIRYHWPGNIAELVNLSRHLLSLWNGRQFSLTSLPEYLTRHTMLPEDQVLTPKEYHILELIAKTPRIGRSRLTHLLAAKYPDLTEARLRSLLSDFASRNLIQIGKTKGGCEITEYGIFMLQHSHPE